MKKSRMLLIYHRNYTTIDMFARKITYMQKQYEKIKQPWKVVRFFHGRLKACEIFRCLNIYLMIFLVPITARHVFIKKIILHYYIKQLLIVT